MKVRTIARATCLAALTIASVALYSPSALAASSTTNFTGHCDPSSPDCGFNPVITGPPPPFVTIPSNCPGFLSSDTWTLDFTGGNSVGHFTANNNGDWGTGTAQGQADLATSDHIVRYSGHLTVWFGGGNNKAGQTDGGFTLAYNGTGAAGSLSIHVASGSTTNNAGTPTGSHTNVTVTCS